MKRLRAVVHGRVQGVGYRAAVQRGGALLEGLTGYVRNMSDGTVEIVAEADDRTLDALLELAEKGSGWARVDVIEKEYSLPIGEFDRFSIFY
jgi:acylphosphatase